MARSSYDRPFHTRRRRRHRGRPAPGRSPHQRMGMHDFSERYGRYSGGDPYAYEYSERTVEHRGPRYREDTGFTRELSGARGSPKRYDRPRYRRPSARGEAQRYTPYSRHKEERRGPSPEDRGRHDRRRTPRGAPWARQLHQRRARRHGIDVDEGRWEQRQARRARGRRWYEPRSPW